MATDFSPARRPAAPVLSHHPGYWCNVRLSRRIRPDSPGTEVELCVPPLGEARNRFTLFIEGDALYDAMLAAIGNAHRRILLESYLFAADDVGQCFVAALVERARAGVEVRLMLDAVGSLLRFPRQVELQLREIGVAVRRFHRWRWRDTHLQVHGPLAAQAAVLFEAFWLDERWTPAAPAGAATVFCT